MAATPQGTPFATRASSWERRNLTVPTAAPTYSADAKNELFVADIARRGITPEQAQLAGIEFTPNARSDVAPEFRPLAATCIPYFDIAGEPISVERGGEWWQFERVRYLEEGLQGFTKKKPQKYAQPAGTRPFAYFPRCEDVDWRAIASDPSQYIVLTEGEFKALSATLAGFPTIGLGGVWNFMASGDLLPELQGFAWSGRPVYICHDNDPSPRTRRNVALAARRLAAELIKRGAVVHIVQLPELADGEKTALDEFLNDPNGGPDAVEHLLNSTPAADPNATLIKVGTDPEIAEAALRDLADAYDSAIVFCEGSFYAYCGTHWKALAESEIVRAIRRFDRTPVGQNRIVRLSKSSVGSITFFMSNLVTDPNFFSDAPEGINAANGFIRFDGAGAASLESHDREHRQQIGRAHV